MDEAPVPESGGWLVELQRARCSGASAMTTYQGLVTDEIVVPQSAAEARDPGRLVQAACDFAEAMQESGLYLPGEFAPEALASYYTQDYLRQALQGGHAQYLANRGGDELALKSVHACLKSMLADPHHEIFSVLTQINAAPPRALRKLAKRRRAPNVRALLRSLDAELAALEAREPLSARHKIWLRSLRKLTIAPDDAARAMLEQRVGANPLRAARAAEIERQCEARTREDPAWRAVKELCDMAGLRFVRLGQGGRTRMRAVWGEGPDVAAYAWRVETDQGPRAAVFYAEGRLFRRFLAVLMEAGGVLPLGSLALNKARFAAIVPPLRARPPTGRA